MALSFTEARKERGWPQKVDGRRFSRYHPEGDRGEGMRGSDFAWGDG